MPDFVELVGELDRDGPRLTRTDGVVLARFFEPPELPEENEFRYLKRILKCYNHFLGLDLDQPDFETTLILRLLEAKRKGDTVQRACVLDDYFQYVSHVPISATELDEKYAKQIKDGSFGDPEADHSRADKLLVHLLLNLGFNKTVKEFEKIDKWYA